MMRIISEYFFNVVGVALFFGIICLNGIKAEQDHIKDDNVDILELLISPEMIEQKVKSTAKMIDEEYHGKEVVIIMIMKGSIFFVSDLIRELTIDTTLEYISCSSYGQRGTSRGELIISDIDKLSITSKHVLLVDDIADSGQTLASVVAILKGVKPTSLKTLVLIEKKKEKICDFHPDWSLFEVEDNFVVGYGLDYKECYRGLRGIYILKQRFINHDF